MLFKEAIKKSFNVEWKIQECYSKSCWCAAIVPRETIYFSSKEDEEPIEELFIIPNASVSKEYAKYIVELHNKSLKND